MRSVLVILAAIVVTVVSGGPAAAENLRKAPRPIWSPSYFLDRSQSNERQPRSTLSSWRATRPSATRAASRDLPRLPLRRGRSTTRAEQCADVQRASCGAAGQAPGVGRRRQPQLYSYTHALNGFAARLTQAEAKKLQKNKAVRRVWEDQRMRVDTNNSPKFLGLTDPQVGLRAKREASARASSSACWTLAPFRSIQLSTTRICRRRRRNGPASHGRSLGRRRLQQ